MRALHRLRFSEPRSPAAAAITSHTGSASRKHVPAIPFWLFAGPSVLVLASMGFFAWLMTSPPSFLEQPYLGHTAIICVSLMFGFLMLMLVLVARRGSGP